MKQTYQYSAAGLAMTKSFEGLRLNAYQDVAGVWTIGYGSTIPIVHPGEVITEQEAEQRLIANMQTAVVAVNTLVKVSITRGQFDGMVDFVFNVGQGNFRNSTLLRKVNAGDFAGSAAQFLVWDEAGGQIEPGLLRRRQAEMAMFTS